MRNGSFLPQFGRLRRGHLPGTGWLVPFLAATLLLCLALGWQAIAAARTHRETAASALRDYAAMAAWEYSRIAQDNIERSLFDLFEDARVRRGGRPESVWELLEGAREVARDNRCECPLLRDPAIVFRYDIAERGFETLTDTVPPRKLAAIATALEARLAAQSRGRAYWPSLFTMPAGLLIEEEAVVAYRGAFSYRDDSNGLHSIFGIVTPVRAFEPLFARWARRGQLLPPSIAGDLPNDSLLHIAVRDLAGATFFESALDFDAGLVAYDTLAAEFGPLVIEASVRPDAADLLVIGGLPKSKLPLILGLLILTSGVGAAGLFQLRRERHLARLRDDFISGVSHELRTPLAQIRVFAELQEAGKLRSDVDRARAISVINREAQRLTHLVENILRFARLRRAAGGRFVTESIAISDAVGDLLEAFRPLAQARRMTIDVDVEPGLRVIANRDALSQMLVNLLDNAVKYGPTGQTIRLRAGRRGNRVVLSIEDQGPGVPAADRHRIWEPYVRLEREMDARLSGTGIGLAIVAQLMALHGGSVHVEDGAAGGARFVLEMPADEPAAALPAGAPVDPETAKQVPA